MSRVTWLIVGVILAALVFLVWLSQIFSAVFERS